MTKDSCNGPDIYIICDQYGRDTVSKTVGGYILRYFLFWCICNALIVKADNSFKFAGGATYMHLATIVLRKYKVLIVFFSMVPLPFTAQL